MKKYCCKEMERDIKFECDKCKNKLACPDKLFHMSNNKYFLIKKSDPGEYQLLEIKYCPWCGKKL